MHDDLINMSLIHDDFLLSNDHARRLYHDHAAGRPIYDYHCHLPPEDLAANRKFKNLTEIWLEGDHYKWRAMRANGIDEKYCTGDADPWEKFHAWANTVPATLRNPLYHWTHLELKRYFDIDVLLNGDTAREVWDEANRQLASLDVVAILKRFDVALICTTDDPADALEHHAALAQSSPYDTAIYPAFRPDKACNITDGEAFRAYVSVIEQASGQACRRLDDFVQALHSRHRYFHEQGCRLSDHGLTHLPAVVGDEGQARLAFDAAVSGQPVEPGPADAFCSYMMLQFGEWDADAGWVSQLHLGAMRNNNGWAYRTLGPDTGFDSIGDDRQGPGLRAYLGELANRQKLPRTVLYNLNPSDNYLFATMAGNFQGGGVPGKVQHGSGWWFLDQREAMQWQLNALSNNGLLTHFVGMLTDSRSFMSYPRHEYFRRVLCDLLGRDMAAGALPDDPSLVGRMVERICFDNARDYFNMSISDKYG